MARTPDAILRDVMGGILLIQVQLQAECDQKDDRIAELEKQVAALTAEVTLLTEQTHARPD